MVMATLCVVIFFIYTIYLVRDYYKNKKGPSADSQAKKDAKQPRTGGTGRSDKYLES